MDIREDNGACEVGRTVFWRVDRDPPLQNKGTRRYGVPLLYEKLHYTTDYGMQEGGGGGIMKMAAMSILARSRRQHSID